jgi:GxxExxY protein
MLTNPAGTNELTEAIIGGAIRVHRDKGPGLLESAYVECLVCEFRDLGLAVGRKLSVPLTYRGRTLETTYELDLLVEGRVIVEVKAVAALAPVHSAQLLTYLKLTGLPVGLLINFNVPVLKQGIRRLVNPVPLARTPSADTEETSGHV